MIKRRLFERITECGKNPAKRIAVENEAEVVRSVWKHMHKLLNIKQGNVLMDADFGMPDFTLYLNGYPDSLRDIKQAAVDTIKKYEPRVDDVSVEFEERDDNALGLRFQLTASLKNMKEPVKLRSIIDKKGGVSIIK